MTQKLLWTLAALVALGAAGCGDSQNCTAIGCENGIALSFEDGDGQAITAFSGTVTLSGQQMAVECGAGAADDSANYSCFENRLFLRATDGSDLSINIHATARQELAYIGGVGVDYEDQYPNGTQCPAACRQAQTTLVMVPTQAN